MTNPPTHAATAYTQPTRFVVGIDLGTTNTAVSYVDMEEARELLQFRIPQLVSAGELADADLLPSFCYLPAGPELPEGALELPWDADPQTTVGLFARNQGAAVPERLIASAKSWLAHAGVDRTRGILPWGGHLDEQALSPIQVSSLYLGHVRAAWDHRFGALRDADGTPCTLSEQHVIVTVPASFDETARELTLRAAHEAGLPKVTLIEEPLAAFYAWLWANETQWQDMVVEGDSVLVLDVGGGTTDFSMVEIEPGFTVRRTAVGDHLLLGGDNMDMALARRAEAAWQTRLPPREWSMLCQECRRIKELLLSPQAPESADIAVAGTGSGIVATTRVHTFRQDEVLALVRDGFFPWTDADAPDPVRSRGIREMGLPYAADPAVTHHLLRFLRLAGRSADGTDTALACPSRILFNGGAMLPEA
ncbi:MAG: Hsp70 family protein, partial [Lentisphaeria bacterium]|nr:Hsp70 family protein [Lentisphaeria bacterium]